MDNVKRYGRESEGMEPWPDGDWVHYDDYVALHAKLRRAELEIHDWEATAYGHAPGPCERCHELRLLNEDQP